MAICARSMSSPTWSGAWLHSPIPLLLNPLPSPSCAQSAATLGILAVFPHTVLLHLPSCRAVVPEWGTPFHRCIIIVSPIPPLRWYLRHHSDHSMLWSQIRCICFAYDNYIYVCEALPKVSVEVVLMMGDKSLVPTHTVTLFSGRVKPYWPVPMPSSCPNVFTILTNVLYPEYKSLPQGFFIKKLSSY